MTIEAARWHTRLAAPDCTSRERAEFECWRRQHPSHELGFQQAARLSAQLTHLAATDARLQAMADAAYAMGHGDGEALARARRWAVPAALAAAILLAVLGVRLAGYVSDAQTEMVPYVTMSAERRDITLEDGSVVHLDVASELRVRMTQDERQLELLNGRALFEVAHDAARPFSVTAGNSRTVALGTHFQVQHDDNERIVVTLTEGSVAVTSTSATTSWQERLHPGEQLRLDPGATTPVVRNADTQSVTSWSRGRLVFRDMPLGEALDEVNRYADGKVRLGDSSLANLAVSGNFIASDSRLIVSAFAAVLPLRAVEGGGNELILFRRYDTESP